MALNRKAAFPGLAAELGKTASSPASQSNRPSVFRQQIRRMIAWCGIHGIIPPGVGCWLIREMEVRHG